MDADTILNAMAATLIPAEMAELREAYRESGNAWSAAMDAEERLNNLKRKAVRAAADRVVGRAASPQQPTKGGE
tara:strand:+ start:1362 stop:1583 length:222 start_codon:yes stop_codon:yes gene_type:complete